MPMQSLADVSRSVLPFRLPDDAEAAAALVAKLPSDTPEPVRARVSTLAQSVQLAAGVTKAALAKLERWVTAIGAADKALAIAAVTVTLEDVKACTVADAASYARAGELRAGIATLTKAIEGEYRDLKADAHSLHKTYTGLESGDVKALEVEDKRLERERIAFQRKADAERQAREIEIAAAAKREEEELAARTAAALEAAGEQALANEVLQQALQAPLPAVSLASTLPTTAGVNKVAENWQFEILAPQLVPRTYCTPDPKLIRAQVAQSKGLTKIPGVRVFDAGSERVRG